MDIKNDYFDKDGVEDMTGEIIIEHDEDADRHLIDMALQLSQQSEANNRTKYNHKLSTQRDRYNRKHGPQFSQSSQFLMPKYFHHPPQQTSVQCT